MTQIFTTKEAEQIINLLPDDTAKQFFKLYYIDGLKLEAVAVKINYSLRWVKEIKKQVDKIIAEVNRNKRPSKNGKKYCKWCGAICNENMVNPICHNCRVKLKLIRDIKAMLAPYQRRKE